MEFGVAVVGRWAPRLLREWAVAHSGTVDGTVASFTVEYGLRCTAWDLSTVSDTLLPMWAKRVGGVVSCVGEGDGARGGVASRAGEGNGACVHGPCVGEGDGACVHGPLSFLQALLPAAPLVAVAVADAAPAGRSPTLAARLERCGVAYVRRANLPEAGRGDAAAATWMFR